MEEIINFFNIPRTIIRYKKRKIIESYIGEKQDKKERNQIIVWVFLVITIALNVIIKKEQLIYISIGCLLLLLLLLKIFSGKKRWGLSSDKSNISKIILKDEEGKNQKVWELHNKTALLIGKKTTKNEVDIDLSNDIYASLISREHGILNFTSGKWYFEDIGSSNGSGIKRKNESKKFKAEDGKSYKISSGDTIYIANTKLLIK